MSAFTCLRLIVLGCQPIHRGSLREPPGLRATRQLQHAAITPPKIQPLPWTDRQRGIDLIGQH